MKITDEERALCMAYADGLLSPEQQLALEQRMGAEPELAALVRGLIDTDELLRRAHRSQLELDGRVRRRRPWLLLATIAAAAAILVWIGSNVFDAPRTRSASFLVAVAPSYESPRELLDGAPELAAWSPPGLEALRGGATDFNISAAEFVERARAVELTRARAAWSAPESEVSAGFFVVTLELRERSDVLVLALSPDRAPTRLVPDSSANEPALLAEGPHCLPSERFRVVGDGAAARVRYERGFLVPLGIERLDVVIAVAPPDPKRGLVSVDGPAQSMRSVEAWVRHLEELGFATRSFAVREPR